MSIHQRLRKFQLPVIQNDFELAEWFRMPLKQLQWYADCKSIERTTRYAKLRHYHYRPLAKRFGQVRLIESPKQQLKRLQRLVLTEFVERIDPHDAVHGFRRGRSIRTNAEQHVGKQALIRMDLHDFFPSITAARVRAVFSAVGYPDDVTKLLTGLCTNAAPSAAWNAVGRLPRLSHVQAQRYQAPHLPQGAPTSPALANLVAYRLDCRLSALAHCAGAAYTRYADDLAFSGDVEFARGARRFATSVAATVMDEGFSVNYRKTRIMQRGVRQQVAGVVVNQRPNIARDEYDRLKATLHNCIRHGPANQNRTGHSDWRGHLTGRVAHATMLNRARGERLRALLNRIEW